MPHQIYPKHSFVTRKLPLRATTTTMLQLSSYRCLIAVLLAGSALADFPWLSPVYQNIFEFPLPVPSIKQPKA